MHAKYEVCISYGSKLIANVKFDNRQTDRQTNRTKTICPRSFEKINAIMQNYHDPILLGIALLLYVHVCIGKIQLPYMYQSLHGN